MSASTPNAFLNIDDAHLRVTSGNVYAQGLNISGVSFSGVSGLHTVTNTGNVTTNTLEFKNGAKAFVATSNVEVKGSLDVANVATIYNGSNADYDQKQKFTSTVSSSGNYFANTLAMSTNGLYAIVGAHGENKTYTFTRSGSTWTQEHTFSSTGYAVDISSHGTYAVVGANGSASVFYRSSGSTWDSGTTLTAAGISVTTGYGASVSISDDGSYAIVGATGQSAAWIFRRTGTTTWDAGVKIALTGFSLGFSVAISGDGLYALLGAHAQHTAYVFKRTGAYLWSQQAKITESDSFGYSVALSTDGSRALIGATGGNGKAYSYERAGSGWSQNAIITASDAASGDAFGSAVSLSSDGSYGIVGAPGSEKAYTFKNAGSVWTELGIETASDTASGHVFGRSVSISGDGIYALIGASGNEAAYSYERKETLVLDVRGEANVRTLNVSDDLIVTNNILASNNLTVAGNLNVTTIRSDSNVVTEYTGPHDRPLRKYPEVALTANDNSSTSGYVASKSSGSTTYDAWKAFDEDTSTYWYSGSNSYYATGDGSATSSAPLLDTGTDQGDWLAIEVPTGIKLESFKLTRHDASFPSSGTLYARNSSGDSWTEIYRYDGYTSGNTTQVFNVNSTIIYKVFALVARTREQGANTTYGISIKYWELYGHEEGSGSLDTTLKTVYNVPATTGTQLEVYYDGQDYTADTDFDQANEVLDKSGNNLHGSQTGGVGFDSTYKAFTFDGTGDYILTPSLSNFTDTGKYSISLWIKIPNYSTRQQVIYQFGHGTIGESFGLDLTNGVLNSFVFQQPASLLSTGTKHIQNNWFHYTTTFDSDGTRSNMYINGVLDSSTSAMGLATIPSNPYLILGSLFIGDDPTASAPAGVHPNLHFDGSIANFRLYSKALNADQVKELYDYQKDYFLGSKSQVTLYKGHLGVGVTEPSGQLELAGDERIQEYPPRDLYQYDTNIEGHGVFCASASIEFTDGNHPAWEAFSDSATSASSESVWTTNGSVYDISSGSYTGSTTTAGIKGEWIQLKTPYKIKISSFNLNSYADANSDRQPRDFILLGSNDGNVWEQMKSVAGQTSGYTMPSPHNTSPAGPHHTVNSTKYYNYFRIVVTANQGGDALVGISRIKLFGTPGPTTLDKGSLTLGRSLDVPRISRYDVDTETPRYEKLVVDFDTTVNSSPTDISGKGNHGEFKNNASYSAPDKAFKFAAANAHIYLNQNTLSGTSATHTFSLWINALSGPGNGSYEAIFEGGVRSNNQAFGLYAYQDGSNTRVYYHVFGSNLPSNTAGYIVNTNSWYHICGTLDNSGNVRRFYVNGELFASDTYGSLNVTHPRIRIGENVDGSESWHGMVSNFKLYSVALEPSEVKKLYNLGRTGRSMVISDTAVGIGKVPEAQLDVRGNIKTSGMVNNAGMRWYISGAGGNAEYTVGENWFSRNGAVVDGVPTVYGTVQRVRNGAEASVWNETTGFFTAPEDGIYSIDLVMFINGFSGSRWGGFQLQNSAGGTEETTYTFYTANITIDDTMSYSKTVYMEKGWKFRFYTPEGTVTLYISGMHSSLNIHKIS